MFKQTRHQQAYSYFSITLDVRCIRIQLFAFPYINVLDFDKHTDMLMKENQDLNQAITLRCYI